MGRYRVVPPSVINWQSWGHNRVSLILSSCCSLQISWVSWAYYTSQNQAIRHERRMIPPTKVATGQVPWSSYMGWMGDGHRYLGILIWLVVLTILKNISQWEGLSHILWTNKNCSKPPTSYHCYNCVTPKIHGPFPSWTGELTQVFTVTHSQTFMKGVVFQIPMVWLICSVPWTHIDPCSVVP